MYLKIYLNKKFKFKQETTTHANQMFQIFIKFLSDLLPQIYLKACRQWCCNIFIVSIVGMVRYGMVWYGMDSGIVGMVR